MTRIGLVSDTHLPRFGRALPRALESGLRDHAVDRIIHCGDHTDPLTIGLFDAIAPIDGVAGNNDGADVRAHFGHTLRLEIEGVRIGVIHGDGRRGAKENALAAFGDDDVDVIFFGHSHRPEIGKAGRRLYVNPGSPTDKRFNPLYSYAIVTLDGGRVEADLKFFASRGID